VAFEFEPTSIKRWEGLVDRRLGVVEGEMGGEGEGGGGGMQEGWVEDSTVMGLM